MSRVEASIEIAAPPDQVWAVVMDPERLEDWVTIHRKLGKAPRPPLERGSEIEQTLCLRGANFKVHWKIDEIDPGRRAVWKGRGPARSHAETVYELLADGSGTRFNYENEFKAPLGPLGTAASRILVGGLPEREAQASLERLKRLLER